MKQFVVVIVTVQFEVLPTNSLKRREALLKWHHTTKTQGAMEVYAYSFLISAPDRGDRPALSSEKKPQGLVSPRASLDSKGNLVRNRAPISRSSNK
jgi:hypothetical protein